tara:strand:- start:4548 stop:5318 length:771 start_codon:yes stop_codon:yes gene_type:complete
MKQKIPNKVFDIDTEEAYKRFLDRSENENSESEIPITTQDSSQSKPYEQDINDNEWIILNENTRELISIDKFHHGNNWNQMHELLQQNNEYMPNISEILKLTKLLLKKKARYADNSPIRLEKQEEIFNEIYEVRDSWRLEYIDARFKKRSNGLYILSNHIIQPDNSLKPMSEEKLEYTLMQDKTPGIDLTSWINNPNKHGLPKESIQDGSFYYWHPRNNNVAWLNAGSVGASLGCDRDPSSSFGRLGVRKKIFHRK